MNQDNQNNNTQVTNENNSEPKETSVYEIPGVIIPDQVTDSGKHLGQNTSTITPEVKEEKKEEVNQGGIYSIPGVIIPQQTTENGTIAEINNVTEENIYKEPEKEIINTDEKPIMPGMMPEKKKEEPKVEKNKKVQKEGNAKLGCLYLVIIGLVLAVLYLAYKAFLNPNTVVSDDVKSINNRIYNKESLIIEELYSRVNLSGCNNLYYNFYNPEVDTISRTDLSDEFKLYMAYLQLKNTEIKEESCANYTNALNKNDKEKKWYCGRSYLESNAVEYNDNKDKTTAIDEKTLKKQVEKMFGKGEYKKKSFGINSDSRYYYDSSSEKYILQTKTETTECKEFKTKLTGVEVGQIELALKIRLTVDGKEMDKIVIFKIADNGNYYFDRIAN